MNPSTEAGLLGLRLVAVLFLLSAGTAAVPPAADNDLTRDALRSDPDEPPPTPIPSPLVERVEVRFVTFDLFVERRGKGGWRRATDLRREDMTVLLGGKPVDLEMFDRHCGPEEGAVRTAGGPTAVAPGTGASEAQAPPAAPGPLRAPLHTILYFDLTHLTNEGANLAYKAALEWASTSVKPDDPVMIVNGGDILRIVRPFLPASQHLREDLIAAREGSRYFERWAEFEDGRAKEIEDVAKMGGNPAALASSYASQDYQKTRAGISSLRLLMTLFEAIEGPKNLLLFENTIRLLPGSQYPYANPREVTDTNTPLARLAADANERQVRIYPVHAGGVEGRADGAMTMLASETGGRVYERSNALSPAFERAAEDAGCFYRLGFPLPRLHRGGSERIAVRVGDGRGYRLRYRRTVADPTREERDLDVLRAAMLVPVPSASFPVAVIAAPLWGGKATGRARVEVRVPLASLVALPAAKPGELGIRAQIGLTVVPLLPREPEAAHRPAVAWADAAPGKRTWSTARQVELKLPATWSAEADPRDLVLVQELDAPPGAYAVIAVAQDRMAGAVSSTGAEFEIPDDTTRLGQIHLTAADPRAIEAIRPAGEEEDPGHRNQEIHPVPSSLPVGMALRIPPAIDAEIPGSVAVALCDTDGQDTPGSAAAEGETEAGGRFAGWVVELEVACAGSTVTPPRPIAVATNGAPCVVVLHPLPPSLPPGDCALAVSLERPDGVPEVRRLAIHVDSVPR